jgi:drug/metabolite transporter (DMT)-like permease
VATEFVARVTCCSRTPSVAPPVIHAKCQVMTTRLSIAQIAVLCAYVAGTVGGQMLFKMAAMRVALGSSMSERGVLLLQNWFFLAAMVAYLALSVVWVWILTFIPISRAYPFLALAIAITPVLGGVIFDEALDMRCLVGIGIIFVGLLVVTGA